MTDERQLPHYQCHKKVWALKINGVSPGVDGIALITPAEEGYAPFTVTAEYVEKHKPEVGGYYVVYPDGYKSFSPAEPFEEGYSLITD